MKRAPAGKKGVTLPKRTQAQLNALDRLPENPTLEEIKEATVHVSLAELEERVADVRDSWETDSLFEDALEDLTDESGVFSGSKLPPHTFILLSIMFCTYCHILRCLLFVLIGNDGHELTHNASFRLWGVGETRCAFFHSILFFNFCGCCGGFNLYTTQYPKPIMGATSLGDSRKLPPLVAGTDSKLHMT